MYLKSYHGFNTKKKKNSEHTSDAIEGFSRAVLNDNYAVAGGNETIHSGNAASPGVYYVLGEKYITC